MRNFWVGYKGGDKVGASLGILGIYILKVSRIFPYTQGPLVPLTQWFWKWITKRGINLEEIACWKTDKTVKEGTEFSKTWRSGQESTGFCPQMSCWQGEIKVDRASWIWVCTSCFRARVVKTISFYLFILACVTQKVRWPTLLTPVPRKKARLTVSGKTTKVAFLSQS